MMKKKKTVVQIILLFYILIICLPFSQVQAKTTPTLIFSEMSIVKTYGDSGFVNGLTKVTDGALSYSSSDTNVATVNASGYVTIKGAGECSITVKAASCEKYVSGSRSYHLTVNRAEPYINFGSSQVSKKVGDAAFRNVLNTNSDGVIQYSSSNKKVADVDAQTGYVTLVGGGSCMITAAAAEGRNYTAATAGYTLNVSADSGGIEVVFAFLNSSVTKNYGDAVFSNPLSANVSGTIHYSSSNSSVASVDNKGIVTIKGAGNCIITASCGNTKASYSLTVNKAVPQMSFANQAMIKKKSDAVFKNALITNTDGTIYYSSSSSSVAVVDANGNITIKGIGDCKITARATAGKNYVAGSIDFSLVIINDDGNAENASGTKNDSNTNNESNTGNGTNTGENSNVSNGQIVTADGLKKIKPVINVKNAGANKVKITWKNVSGAQQYYIYSATKINGKYKLMKSLPSSQSFVTVSKLKKNKVYYFKMQCSTMIKGKKVYSQESGVVSKKVIGAPPKPKMYAKTSGKDALILYWKKQPKVNGIAIYQRVNKGKYKKIKTISGKKTSYKISLKKFEKTNVYYFCIRTYYSADGVKVWSKSSNSRMLH